MAARARGAVSNRTIAESPPRSRKDCASTRLRSVQCAAQRLQVSDKRLRDGARPSAGNRPSDRMRGDAQHQSRSRTQRLIEGQKGMSGQPGKQRAGANAFEMAVGQRLCGLHRRDAKPRHQQRMRGNTQHRPEAAFGELRPALGKWLHEFSAMLCRRRPAPARRHPDRAPAPRPCHRPAGEPAAHLHAPIRARTAPAEAS